MFKRFAVFMFLLAMLALLPTPVLAESAADPQADVRLTLICRSEDVALAGVSFDIYRVATVGSDGITKAVPPFDGYNINLRVESESALNALAGTLESYVLRDHVSSAMRGETDSEGRLRFSGDLQQGLYLVLGARHVQDGLVYTFDPMMVFLPTRSVDQQDWIYDVVAYPKSESRPEPDEDDTVTRKVLKIWRDEGHEALRPESITVQLLRDGELHDTVTLTAEGGWRHSWEGLDANCHWTVVEAGLQDYTVEITREGITFLITNTHRTAEPEPTPSPSASPEPDTTPDPDRTPDPNRTPRPEKTPKPTKNPDEPDKPDTKLPQTGELWWPVPMLLAAGLLLIVIGLIRRRGI